MQKAQRSASVAEIRATISRFKEHRIDEERRTQPYPVNRSSAEGYLGPKPTKMRRKVYDFLHSLKEKDEPVVYVDICGRAKLGLADINYSFSLEANRWISERVSERFVGDLFSAKDFYGFLGMIRDHGFRPSFVTCVPIAGLCTYYSARDMKLYPRYEEVLYQRLENNLRAMIKLLRPGGFIFLSDVLQGEGSFEFFTRVPHEKRKATLFVKAICDSMRCSVELDVWHGGTPSFLIRKWLR